MNRPDPSDPTGTKRIFVDATEDSHLLDTRDGKGGYAFGVASLGDVDNDGDLDVVVGPSDAGAGQRLSDDPGAVMLNDGKGRFSLGPAGTGLDKVTGYASATCTLLDYDKDGALDFLPGTFAYPPPNFKPPVLLRGTADGNFVDMFTELWPHRLRSRHGRRSRHPLRVVRSRAESNLAQRRRELHRRRS